MNVENLGWCKPYFSHDNKSAIVVTEGKASALLWDGAEITDIEEQMERFARSVNADYGDYSGWSDLHIALDAMTEGACSDCPWFDSCEAMTEQDDEQ